MRLALTRCYHHWLSGCAEPIVIRELPRRGPGRPDDQARQHD